MSIVKRNLMTVPGYAPYCGDPECKTMPRSIFNGDQFVCPHCGWESYFDQEFIESYKDKWGLGSSGPGNKTGDIAGND